MSRIRKKLIVPMLCVGILLMCFSMVMLFVGAIGIYVGSTIASLLIIILALFIGKVNIDWSRL